MTRKKDTDNVIYETLGSLSSDVKNLNQRFVELAGAFQKISDVLCEIKESQRKIDSLEKMVEKQKEENQKNTLRILEQFGLAFDHREEIRKNMTFLDDLQNTKKKFTSSFVCKIAEWAALVFIASYLIPKLSEMGLN